MMDIWRLINNIGLVLIKKIIVKSSEISINANGAMPKRWFFDEYLENIMSSVDRIAKNEYIEIIFLLDFLIYFWMNFCRFYINFDLIFLFFF